MKQLLSIETLYALIFAVCVLAALLLLTGCGKKQEGPSEPHPAVQGQ